MAIQGYTEQELATLTPDERSALEAESATDADAELLTAIAGEGGDDASAVDEGAADAAAGETPPEDGKKEAAAEGAAAEAEVGKEAASADDDKQSALPGDKTFHAEAPADIAEQRKALRAEDAAALKKLMDGEIEPEVYAEIKAGVSEKLDALTRAEVTADVSARMAVQAKANEWTRELNSAVVAAKKDGLDYLGNKELGAEFDSLLRVYSDRAMAQGMTDDNLEASKWALAEASKMMRKMHGTSAKPAAEERKKDETPAAQRHNLATLGKLPSADRAPIADDVMSKVGSLQGEDLEKYMATLSSKEIDRIMAGT